MEQRERPKIGQEASPEKAEELRVIDGQAKQ